MRQPRRKKTTILMKTPATAAPAIVPGAKREELCFVVAGAGVEVAIKLIEDVIVARLLEAVMISVRVYIDPGVEIDDGSDMAGN